MKKTLRFFALFLGKLLPLKPETVFLSFNGHYSDSPKAISEELYKQRPDIKQIWLVERNRLNEIPSYATGVDVNSFSAFLHLATAAVVVDNAYLKKGFELNGSATSDFISIILVKLYTRKHQLNISTWHGTPLKKMGIDQVNINSKNSKGFVCAPMTMFHPNRHTRDVMDRITFRKISHEIIGLPRNDILFKEVLKDDAKKRCDLPQGKKVVLYAPTFRNDGNGTINTNIERSGLMQIKSIDFNLLFSKLSEIYGGEWIFVGRFHYLVETLIDWNELERKYPGKIVNGNSHDDMSDYLLASDVLITDCSSCMFDFALTARPCFLYFPDSDYYEGKERGFYFPLDSLPFECSRTFEGLIENIDKFDMLSYQEKLKEMRNMLDDVDDGHASERCVDYLITHSLFK